MAEAWAVVAAALGSALLTIVGSFWLERWRVARSERRATGERLREACVQLNGRALNLSFRANALYITSIFRSGLTEGLDVLLHYRKPVDPMELTDWLLQDLKEMVQAQSLIEVLGDRELIRSAADLVLAGSVVLEKASDITKQQTPPANAGIGKRVLHWLGTLRSLRRDPEVEQGISEAVAELGRQARRFAALTRERLGVNDPDAVVAAFPHLFAEDRSHLPDSTRPNLTPGEVDPDRQGARDQQAL